MSISIVHLILSYSSIWHTKVFNCYCAYKTCHFEFVYTKSITDLMQFCVFIRYFNTSNWWYKGYLIKSTAWGPSSPQHFWQTNKLVLLWAVFLLGNRWPTHQQHSGSTSTVGKSAHSAPLYFRLTRKIPPEPTEILASVLRWQQVFSVRQRSQQIWCRQDCW